MKKYESLKEQYPDYISLNQLYQICRISKRSARYLLQNGIIPCIESDSLTWRYKIAVDDVITYLRRREQWGSMIPRGAVNNKKSYRKKKRPFLIEGSDTELEAYFQYIYADYPDLLTTFDVADMTGLCRRTIYNFIKTDVLRAISNANAYFIPKDSLIEFAKTQQFIHCNSPSETYRKIIGGFESLKQNNFSPP